MTTTSSRLLELLALLQARRDWPGGELANRLEVSRRTVRRDVERLRELGYPVESLPGPAGGYRLRAGTAMPPLLLDDDEAIAIAVGLRTAARASVTGIEETAVRALVKLEQVLPAAPAPARPRPRGGDDDAAGGGPTVDPQALTVIATRVPRRRARSLRIPRSRRRRSRREVEPHSLVNLGRRWYLVAWDPAATTGGRSGVDRPRAARVDRGSLRAPETSPPRTRPPTSPHSISAAPSRYEARVTRPRRRRRGSTPGAVAVGDGGADRRRPVRVPDRGRRPRAGWRCASRCSGSSSRSTSRPSWSPTCAPWAVASNARRGKAGGPRSSRSAARRRTRRARRRRRARPARRERTGAHRTRARTASAVTRRSPA